VKAKRPYHWHSEHRNQLKRSNEVLLKKYGNLAKFIAGKSARSFRLSREQTDDLYHSLLVLMFRAPNSYRNYRGISVIFKTRLNELIRRILKSEQETYMGLIPEGVGLKTIEPPTDPQSKLNISLDIPAMLARLDRLSSPERAVIGMSFGVDSYAEFSDDLIARRLGKKKSWVSQKRKAGIEKLRAEMGL
jgi:DNA-directed RNA polymerase specialized sigma subunit